MHVREDGPELLEGRTTAHRDLCLAYPGLVCGGAEEQHLHVAQGLLLGLRDVTGTDYYLQSARYDDELGGLVADDLAVDSELEPGLGSDPNLLGSREEPAFV